MLIKRVEPPTKSAGGLLLPEAAQSTLNEGVVMAVGPGARAKDGSLIPLGVKEGDRVLLPEYGGNAVKLDKVEFLMYRDDDLLAVFSD